MDAQVNTVTVALVEADPFMLPADGLALEVDPGLRLPPALAEAVGIEVLRELAVFGRVDVGEAVVTSGGTTSFRQIIHAVTPRWGEGSERGKLMNVTHACLALADSHGVTALALPAFSVGERGYPVESCASIMLTEIIDFTFEDLETLSHVTVACPSQQIYAAFVTEFERQLKHLADEA